MHYNFRGLSVRMIPDLFVWVFCFGRKILYNILVGWRFLVCMFSRCCQCCCSTIHVKSDNYTRVVCKLHWSSLSGRQVFFADKMGDFCWKAMPFCFFSSSWRVASFV